jgi:uncharacterized membrane protein
MSLKFAKIVSLAAVAAAAGFSLWARARLPDVPIATHFDAAGHANGYMPRDMALAFMPAMGLGLGVIMLWILPAIMPKTGRLERSSEAYGASVVVLLLFLSLVHAGVIALALHYPVDLKRMVLFGIGLLFAVLGNYLPKTRFNYVMGIRSPWTLASEEVWDRTHRFSGPLFMLLGAFVIGDAALAPFPLAFMLMVPAALAVSLVCVGYSYIVARKLNLA